MLRENQDVFDVFSRKAAKLDVSESFVETLANFIYNDLTRSQSDKKLAVVMKNWIREEVKACGSDWKKLERG